MSDQARLSLGALMACLYAWGAIGIPSLHGQAYGSPSPSTAPASATGINLNGGGVDPDALGKQSEKVWNTESDAIDAENGTFQWKGRTFNIGQGRAARARFERYLSEPGLLEDDRRYLEIIDRIQSLLSQVKPDSGAATDRDCLFEAWQLLFEAGSYELDEGNSVVVANLVHNIWKVRDENQQLDRARNRIESEKSRYESLITSNAWHTQQRVSTAAESPPATGGAPSAKAPARRASSAASTDNDYQEAKAAFDLERLQEIKTRLGLMESQSAVVGIQAKLEYQSQLVAFMISRRHAHVMIGNAFYRNLFKGSHQDLQIGREQIRDIVPVSDFKPTVETLDILAREALADVRTGMKTVESLIEGQQLHAALERMQETYLLGEYTLAVRTLPVESRRALLGVYRKSRELENLMDFKDFTSAEKAASELKAMASDFPYTEVTSILFSAQRLSNLALMAAQKCAFSDNDPTAAESHLKKATEIWPLNPAIHAFTSRLAETADLSSQGILLFDELYSHQDWRGIYARATQLGAAVSRDEERRKKLETLVQRLSKIDILIAQAQELALQENAYAGWEILLSAYEMDPRDSEVARAQAALAPRVARYVEVLESAHSNEREGRLAISLNRYLSARRLYPASRVCRLGIERVSRRLMDSLPSSVN